MNFIQVTLKPEQHFEVVDPNGNSLGSFKVLSEWEGFARLGATGPGARGETLVVHLGQGVQHSLPKLLGSEQKVTVVAGSPEMLCSIQVAARANAADTQ